MPKPSTKPFTEFYLVRHYPTKANMGIKRFQGQFLDLSLTADGKRDSKKLRKTNLKDIRLVIHSPAKRAVETMEGLTQGRESEHDIRLEPRLAERNVGVADGKTRAEVFEALAGKIPKPLEDSLRKNIRIERFIVELDQLFGEGPLGGETFAMLRARARETLLELAEEHPGEKIVLVTHAAWTKAVLSEAMNLSEEKVPYAIPNGSITVVRVQGKRISLSKKPALAE